MPQPNRILNLPRAFGECIDLPANVHNHQNLLVNVHNFRGPQKLFTITSNFV